MWKEYKNYKISENGEVWGEPTKSNHNRKGKMMTIRKNIKGYNIVTLYYNNKTHIKSVHRLVYELYVGEIPVGFDVHHKDNNKYNNNFNNLDIIEHSYHTKIHKLGSVWNKPKKQKKVKVIKDRTLNKTYDMKLYQKNYRDAHSHDKT